MDDQPKQPEPEIPPQVPNTEPGRDLPEIPDDKHAPEKESPARGEQ